ncbi:MAG: biotin--[acetyl-CoA-carboxylase] ligase [Acutalibacteraceae bacterium]
MKNALLKLLCKEKGTVVSGAKLSNELQCSRNYVWKLVEQLKEEGIEIHSVNRKGYYIPKNSPNLFDFEILENTKEKVNITVLKETTSTNKILKEMAERGAEEKTVVFAEHQTQGRGRLGRTFYSPKGTGLYLSILLKPKKNIADAMKITTTAGVAVARAVRDVLGIDLKIKWVNDLYLENKKVCGILSESAFDLESGSLSYCVLGIGLNVFNPKDNFNELEGIAGALLNEEPNGTLLARLSGAVLNNFFELYEDMNNPQILEEYRKRSFLQGKDVTVVRGDESINCKVTGIGESGELLCKLPNGEERAFISGEVRLENYR